MNKQKTDAIMLKSGILKYLEMLKNLKIKMLMNSERNNRKLPSRRKCTQEEQHKKTYFLKSFLLKLLFFQSEFFFRMNMNLQRFPFSLSVNFHDFLEKTVEWFFRCLIRDLEFRIFCHSIRLVANQE